jgi:parallel beta-helix repeat protein
MGTLGKTIALVLVSAFLISLVSFSSVTVKASPKTITVPTDYPTISAAIGNASSGDTIIVKSGTYSEQTLEINKTLSIISEIPYQAIILLHPPSHLVSSLGGGYLTEYDDSMIIQADNVKFSGFEVLIVGGDVSVNGSQIQITNNTFATQGPQLIQVDVSGNGSQVIGNSLPTLATNGYNELAINGYNQTATDNTAWISVSGSFNDISRNYGPGIALTGSNNTITGNAIPSGLGAVGIQMEKADYNIISNNTEIGANVGIGIGYPYSPGGSYNVFSGNIVEGAKLWGILVSNGSSNVFYGNLIANNIGEGHDGFGLALGGTAENNLFYNNAFVNNSYNFGGNWQVTGLNSFDNGTVGNYWDDYLTKYPSAAEVDHSGIGDTPYQVYPNCNDNYPLLGAPDISKLIPTLHIPWAQTLPPDSFPSPSPSPTNPPASTTNPQASPTNPITSSTDPPSVNPTTSPNATTAPHPALTATPAAPEFPPLALLPLFLSMLSVAIILRHRKTNSNLVKKV